MALWIFQGLLNVFFVALAVAYILQSRKLLSLEKDLRRALEHLRLANRKQESTAPVAKTAQSSLATSHEKGVETPLGSLTSTLSERKATDLNASVEQNVALSAPSKYVLAKSLLQQGYSLVQAAEKSGLSQSEIALLGKLPTGTGKNYQAH